MGLPRWLSGKESICQCRRRRFHPWVGKIPWRKKWQLTSVFLPGKIPWTEALVGYSPGGHREWDTTEQEHREWKASERTRSQGHTADAQETRTLCMLVTDISRQGHAVLKALAHCGPFWQSKKSIIFYSTRPLKRNEPAADKER